MSQSVTEGIINTLVLLSQLVNTSQILAEVYFFPKVQCCKMLKLSVIQNKLFTVASVIGRILV